MLPTHTKLGRLIYFPLFVGMLCFSAPAFAEVNTTLSAADMLRNFIGNIPNLMRLVTAFAYVAGLYFVIVGIIKLKHAGEMRMHMSYEHSMKTPMILITVGAMLLYLPSAVQMGMSTFWTDPNPYGYLKEQDQWAQFFNACFMVVQLWGTVAFIRGLIILSRMAGHGGHHGSFGRGMTHIIGGILCINIYQFVQVIMITFGIQSVLG